MSVTYRFVADDYDDVVSFKQFVGACWEDELLSSLSRLDWCERTRSYLIVFCSHQDADRFWGVLNKVSTDLFTDQNYRIKLEETS